MKGLWNRVVCFLLGHTYPKLKGASLKGSPFYDENEWKDGEQGRKMFKCVGCGRWVEE